MDIFIRSLATKYLRILKKYSSESLTKLLAALEYSEGILEITAAKVFGEKFKWFIIFLTSLVKCVIRLQLLIVHKFGIQSLPSLFTLKNFLGSSDATNKDKQAISTNHIEKLTFKLKHSGRVVRSIQNAPRNLETRDWIIPGDNNKTDSNNNYIEDTASRGLEEHHIDPTLDRQRYIAEVLHIVRPMCHLSSLAIFKSNSWKQFIIPFVIDSLSLMLMSDTRDLSKSQKSELNRRRLLMLYYFIRTPFYEKYSNTIITIILGQIEHRVSGSKFLIGPIRSYIPEWRSIYNYCWTS